VQLKNNGGTVIATTTTDASGYYRFDGLLAAVIPSSCPPRTSASPARSPDCSQHTDTFAGDKRDKGVDNSSPAPTELPRPRFTLAIGSQTGGDGHRLRRGRERPFGDDYDDLTVDLGSSRRTATTQRRLAGLARRQQQRPLRQRRVAASAA
jgi:hypothetical protein